MFVVALAPFESQLLLFLNIYLPCKNIGQYRSSGLSFETVIYRVLLIYT